MGWSAAPPVIRTLAVVAFLGVAAACAAAAFKPENPQYALLSVFALGTGGIVGACVLGVGEFLSRPSVADWLAPFLRRDSYTRHTTPLLLQAGILAAVFAAFVLHLARAVREGDALSGWTAALLAAIILYPFIRHRIERGRWPD